MSSKSDLDHFYQQAKSQGYRARSVFKLVAIDEKYKLFKAGMRVVDLGASPGSWMQYLMAKVGGRGRVVGFDLNPLKVAISEPHVFVQASVFDLDVTRVRELIQGHIDALVSDMAPHTSGHAYPDHVHSMELCEKAFDLATQLLKPKGIFICKMFQGEHSKAFLDRVSRAFTFCKVQKPQASRSESKEVFIVAHGFRGV